MSDLAMTAALLVSVAANIGLGLSVARIRLAPDPVAAAHERELARHVDKIEHLTASVRMHRNSAAWLQNELGRRLSGERHKLSIAEAEIGILGDVAEEAIAEHDRVSGAVIPLKRGQSAPIGLSRAPLEAAK